MHNNCRKTFWTITNCSLIFVMFDATRKNRPQYFFHWKNCLFSKICVFNNLLGPKKMLLLVPQQLSEYLVEPYKLFPEVCHTRCYEKNWATIFFSLEKLPFFSEIGVLNNLLGPEKELL